MYVCLHVPTNRKKKIQITQKKHRRNIVGTGLGLSIVKKILDQHNIKYGIKSKVNEYTTFYVKFHK